MWEVFKGISNCNKTISDILVSYKVFVHRIDVVFQLGRNGDDGGAVGDGTADKLEDGLVVLERVVLPHQIDLVLQNNNVVELHDLDSGQMLGGLGLGAGFVSGNQEQGSVHDSGT